MNGVGSGNGSEAPGDISCFLYVAVIILQQHHRFYHVLEHHHCHAKHG